MAGNSRQRNLESILRWSLRQQDGGRSSVSTADAEVTHIVVGPLKSSHISYSFLYSEAVQCVILYHKCCIVYTVCH